MECIYESNSIDNDCGKCTLESTSIGCDNDGYCICSEDPDPSFACEDYESDSICFICGCDLNVEECDL